MFDLTLILLAAGSSTRFELDVKKQWLRVGHQPLWQFVADRFEKTGYFEKIIVTSSLEDINFMKNYSDYTFVEGGNTRQDSLRNSLDKVDTKYVLVSDIARSCISKEFLEKIILHKGNSDSIVPYLKVNDTVVYEDKTIDRDKVKRVQTPQLSLSSALRDALKTDEEYTDESSAIVANGGSREFILGEADAHKITHLKDLKELSCLSAPSIDTLSGTGFDVHAFDEKGDMYLGGIKIDSDYGFKAHSDGDVAIHALIDALLGAAGMGDIGMMFPDNDDMYKGIDSKELLKKVVTKLYSFGFVIVNVDLTIAAQKPRIGSYKLSMRKALSAILNIDSSRVNIKATTTEKLGFIGRGEGVGVIANANLKYFDWTKI
ncbi:bifunctional 2-C-methyl-D-erythritol 4-phosphate cytidylyltransferase/2-C-methyl-D-erythritol 2,4-cyclodiphosphate synthase [Sulfurimonas sp.]|uniref:bifunctional 2-C-methyl-D-erythritol 4-phosphate cytidylyltransferase/2-C-methyl-D-erythritol 2,4-cyclodiphosphate synthase n=1 Tax=Sulfurimonas sp. TaxID=2022749 RepID=UPI00262B106D|nr:bifunctional 2-C-methyl-D-erythritol 4-phosphate cytidylyltransferase/2-C-methyl-D-erythritol 2,4-cyclodiphosphate synthase [Sulfurimonas sp.]MCW8895308.1 bifunctional 2-C-methyl-D-erythritol 4-phosphate cytidylyltransferase/2-C-methyl-D-erythritol 2,4-cyclodiphosphate synthase [Sulfurimonas sp.]MCW9067326.1 bifunctional 2-C-methyl-D-erythritol 4-phosphate cytidylyltransferase/2-C-methyl-D-erythritol 2,4-cyclodiphosphate synthase [Sulfurimonas sp.]